MEKEDRAWELKIRKVNNGYIIEHYDESNDEEPVLLRKEQVVQEKDTTLDEDENYIEQVNMQDLIWEIKEYFGIHYSKHNKTNLVINIEKNKDE